MNTNSAPMMGALRCKVANGNAVCFCGCGDKSRRHLYNNIGEHKRRGTRDKRYTRTSRRVENKRWREISW